MKTINKILGFSAMTLLGLFAVSCIDGNDWEVDSSYSRLFSVGDDNITVTADTTSATVEFSSVNGAEYYIIEVSEDSLYNDIALGGTASSIVYGQDGSITSSPVVIDGLVGETKYYLRMKAISSTTTDSNWAYYKSGGTFKTLTEQLFYDLADDDVTSTSVHLTWQAGAEVTHLGYKTGSDEEFTMIALDAATIAAGEYTFEDLQSTTTYTFVLYNGDVKRGSLSVTTVSAAPDADYTYTIPSGTTRIDQDLMDEIAAEAQAAAGQTNVVVTISLPAGETLDVSSDGSEAGTLSSVSIPEGVSVTFWCGSANRPTLSFSKSLEIGGYHSSINFENVNIADGGCQYIINQSNACNIGEMTFKSVDIDGLERSLVRFQQTTEKTIGKLVLDDCIMGNQGSGGYAFIYNNVANSYITEIEVTNSTFYTMQHNFIQVPSPGGGTDNIRIENCTFYNIIGSGRYFIDAQDMNTDIYLTNLVLAKTYTESSSKGGRTAGTFYCSGVLTTSDFVISSNSFKPDVDLTDDEITSDDLFVDPENGDFTIQISKYATYGDPRWYPEED